MEKSEDKTDQGVSQFDSLFSICANLRRLRMIFLWIPDNRWAISGMTDLAVSYRL